MLDQESKALLWICEAKNGDYCRIELRKLISNPSFDWQHFLKLCNRHGLVPLCHRNSQLLIPELIPTHIAERLRARYLQIAQRNLQIVNECKKIQRLCDKMGIPISFMKGHSLAIQLYKDPTLRTYSDVDFFCDRINSNKLLSTVASLNYNHVHQFTTKQFRYHTQKHKDFPLRNKDKNILLEAHWAYTENHSTLKALADNNQTYIQHITWQSLNFTTLDPSAHCCYLAHHGASHGWSSHKWIIDFYHALQSGYTKNLKNYCIAFGTRFYIDHAILLCNKFFSCKHYTPIFTDLSAKTNRQANIAYNLITLEGKKTLIQRLKKYQLLTSLAEGLPASYKALSQMFVSSYVDWKDLNIPDQLFFLYFISRPIKWFKTHILKIKQA